MTKRAEKRTDVHTPSNINPSDYEFVSIEFKDDEGDALGTALENAAQAQYRIAHIARTGGKFNGHYHGAQCDICGAHMIYSAVYYHEKSNGYIRTGHDCAEKLGIWDTREENLFKKVRDERTALRQAKAGKLKAIALLKERDLWDQVSALYVDGNITGSLVYPSALQADIEWISTQKENSHITRKIWMAQKPFGIVSDLISKLVKYGHLSEAQWRLLAKLLDQIKELTYVSPRKAAEEESESFVMPPEGKTTVQGKVLATKTQEGFYGYEHKMLVQCEGYKVWSTVPSKISDVEKGQMVRFNADLMPKEAGFAIAKRPSKAEILKG